MAYGTLKVDTITFTNGGADQNITVSGIVASTSGNLTATGTISGSVIQGGTLVSGATVTGAAGQFTNLTAVSGVFTTQVSGATITGNVGQFTSLTGISAGFTTVTGTTVTGTTANFVTVSGTTATGTTANFVTVSGTTVTGTTANFVTLSGTTVTGTTASFTSGVFTNLSGGVCTITSGVLAVGSATNPSLSFDGDANTGIYSPNAEAIGFTTNGQARLVLDADGQLEAASIGSASTPIYSFGSDPNTGMYSPGADQLAFSTNGTGRLFIDSSGNVGIGTTSPGAALEVAGNIFVSANAGSFRTIGAAESSDTTLLLQGGAASGTGGNIELSRDGNNIYDGATHVFRNVLATSEYARIDSSGRLLIGTSSARSNFFNGSFTPSPVQIEGNTFGSSLLSITCTQNGTEEPGVLLSKARGTNGLVSNGDLLGSVIFSGADGTELVESASIKAAVDGTPGANDMPGRLVFSTTADASATPTERLRITSAGVLQIADAGDIAVGTTTGTKIGTATSQKIGFYNATPVVQPAAVADATDAATVITQLNDLLAKLRTLGLIAT